MSDESQKVDDADVQTAADEPVAQDATEVVTSDSPPAEATEANAASDREDEGTREPKEPATEADEETPKEKRSRRDREIANLRRQQAASERRIQELEARLSESNTSKPDPRPKASDFDTDDQYEKELIQWGIRDAASNSAKEKGEPRTTGNDAEDADLEKVMRRELGNEPVDSFYESMDEARTRCPDFDSVARSESLAVTPLMLAAMMESERGADVLYYLGQHPDEAHRIARHGDNGIAIVRAIARIEAKLEDNPKGNGKAKGSETEEPTSRARASRRPQAPEPIEPLRGGGGSTTPNPERMSQREYEAYRRKQEEARNRW